MSEYKYRCNNCVIPTVVPFEHFQQLSWWRTSKSFYIPNMWHISNPVQVVVQGWHQPCRCRHDNHRIKVLFEVFSLQQFVGLFYWGTCFICNRIIFVIDFSFLFWLFFVKEEKQPFIVLEDTIILKKCRRISTFLVVSSCEFFRSILLIGI